MIVMLRNPEKYRRYVQPEIPIAVPALAISRAAALFLQSKPTARVAL